MKRLVYVFVVLLIALAISFSVNQFFTPLMKAVIVAKDLGSIFSAAEMLWQFLLLGFVMGGVIFAIPTHDLNRDYFKLSGSFSILGSIILVATIGFGIAAKDSLIGSPIVMVISQIGLTFVYAGIAMTAIELVKEILRFVQKSLNN